MMRSQNYWDKIYLEENTQY